jgi:DNA-binding MarR family transcriptional regulator
MDSWHGAENMATRANQRARPSAAAPRSKPALVHTRAGDDQQFDRLVYERVRLGIMSALAVREELTFTELKAQFDVSDGNLSAHARKLEEAGYLSCTKTFAGRRPKTAYRLTARGRAALNSYLDHIEAVIKATRRT